MRPAMTESTTRPSQRDTPTATPWLLLAVIVLVALAICAAVGLLAYSFYATYGPVAGESFFSGDVLLDVGSTAAPFVVVATMLLAVLAAIGSRRLRPAGRRVRFVALLGASLVVAVVVAFAGAWLGTMSKQRGQGRAADACSAQE